MGSVEELTIGVVRALAVSRLDYGRVTSWKGTVTSRGSQSQRQRRQYRSPSIRCQRTNRTVRSGEELFDRGYFAFEIVHPERKEGRVALRLQQ